jgi:hypothetical protein
MEVSGNIGDVEMNSSKTTFSIAVSVVHCSLRSVGVKWVVARRPIRLGSAAKAFLFPKLHADYVEFWM